MSGFKVEREGVGVAAALGVNPEGEQRQRERENGPLEDYKERKDQRVQGDFSAEDSNQNIQHEKAFRSACHQNDHQDAGHTGENPFICSLCAKSFTQAKSLQRHLEAHAGNRPYQCSLCDWSFRRLSNLQEHKKVHTGEKPFTCDYCGKGSSNFSDLKKHVRIHTGEKPFTCTQCGKCFPTSASLARHMYTHKETQPHLCSHCGKGFKHLTNLRAHEKIHSEESPFTCSECGKRCSKSSALQDHMRIHTKEKPFICTHCWKRFSFASTLMRHMYTHTEKQPHQCSQCGKNFIRLSQLKAHQKTHAREEKQFQEGIAEHLPEGAQQAVNYHLKIHTGEGPFTCPLCGKSFPRAKSLKWHMDVHAEKRPHQCSECGKTFKRLSNLREHAKIHTGERPFPCSLCGKTFLKLSHLKGHVMIHTKEQPFSCTYCGNSFSTAKVFGKHRCKYMETRRHQCSQCEKSYVRRSQLKIHQRIHADKDAPQEVELKLEEIHSSEDQDGSHQKDQQKGIPTEESHLICILCRESFTDAESLQRHMEAHAEERPHVCSQCDWRFKDLSFLREHEKVHTGEKPFICYYCGKGYSSSGDLKKHTRIHTREKPFTCVQCGKSFTFASSLSRHMYTHTETRPHPCSQCGKGFVRIANLRAHVKIHSGESPFTCAECGKPCLKSSALQEHMRIHTKERPYMCTQCWKPFTTASTLKRHIYTHREKQPHQCSLCDMSFIRPLQLKTHQRTHAGAENVSQEDSEVEPIPEKNPLKEEYIADKYHQGINPYERFDHSDASQQTVKDHLKIHTGESPVSCFKAKPEEDLVQEECHVTNSQHISQHGKKCSYPFQQTPKDHVEIHTGDNSPLQFGLNHIQEQCGAEKSNLSVHHKRFCRDASQQIMNDHLKIHTGENPFTSFEPTLEDNHYQEQHNADKFFQSIQHGKDCSDAFQETATDHLKIHTGESPVSYFQPKLEDHHFQEEHNGDEFYQSIQPEPHSTQQTVGNHLIHSPIHTGDSSVSCLDPKTEVNLFQEACSVDKSRQNIQHERMCSDATKQTVEDHLSIHTGHNPISCLELTMEENHLQEKCSADKFCKSIQHEEIHSDAPQQTMEDHLKIHAGENSVFGLEPKNEENLFQEKRSVGRSQHNILHERMCSDATKETVEDHLKIHTGDNPMACLELKMEENHIQEKCSAEKFRQSIEHDEFNSDAPQQTMEDDLKIHAGDNLVFCLEPKKEENLFQENCGVEKSQQNIQHERMCSETIQQTVEDHLKIHTGDNHLTCKEPKKEENHFERDVTAEKSQQIFQHEETCSDSTEQTVKDHLNIHTGENPMACLEPKMEENLFQEECSVENSQQNMESAKSLCSSNTQQTVEDHLKIHTGDNHLTCKEPKKEENHFEQDCTAEKSQQIFQHDETCSDSTEQTVKDHLKIHTRDNPVAFLEPKVEETLFQEECSVENCQQNIQRESLCSSNTQQTVEDHLKIHTGDNDPFTCSTCGKNFSSARSLQWHMDVHAGKRPHQCSQCGKSFKRLSNLREHGKIHTGERPFPCSQCGKSFLKLSNLKDHVLIHTRERPFGCTYCGNSFSAASVFGKHRCKYMEKRRHQCSQCEKSYVRRSQLKMHQGIHHRTPTDTEKDVKLEDIQVEPKLEDEQFSEDCSTDKSQQNVNLQGASQQKDLRDKIHTGAIPFSCSLCRKSFSSAKFLQWHVDAHAGKRPHQCSQCDQSFRRLSNLREHEKVHSGEKPFTCAHCGKACSSSSDLRKHTRVHTGEKPFSCTQCGKSFTFASSLMRHILIHTETQPHPCSRCGKSFKHLTNLRAHEKIHSGESPFTCTECGKPCLKSSALQDHMRIHTKERPFICTRCWKPFTTASTLKRHIYTHREKQPQQCSQCGKSFIRPSQLKAHQRTHAGEKTLKSREDVKVEPKPEECSAEKPAHPKTLNVGENPFTCPLCRKGFSSAKSLECHIDVHEGKRPYKCPQCDWSFKCSANLREHRKVHTGERRHTCSHCGKSFSKSSNLQRHQMLHKVPCEKTT